MKEESKNKHTLNTYYIPELKKILEAVKTGTIAQQEWFSSVETTPDVKEDTNLKQKELVKLIHTTAADQLRDILKSDSSFYMYNIEQPCEPYGRMDMLYMDSIYSYPTEIKKDTGEHDLIGQIMKYDLNEKLHLHMKMFYKVQPVTICGSYNGHTLHELKKYGVVTIKYSMDKNQVILKLIS
jgi:hypothetical protein